ncbi:hypothetical protein QG37_02016 [Candidozyma auris]|uniref:Uncharacterized protein n=1 Tax=Candidozyma auris TaxID=498019 RepID=A0A0L0P4I2_CANAR|nr:hypothetical protein QG37_02016 [[Candida] auris]
MSIGSHGNTGPRQLGANCKPHLWYGFDRNFSGMEFGRYRHNPDQIEGDTCLQKRQDLILVFEGVAAKKFSSGPQRPVSVFKSI